MEDKSVILLGNGGCLSKHRLGSRIDSFDEVVRINRFKTIGYEDIAGSKTTIWCTYNPLVGFSNFIRDYKNLNMPQEEIRNIVKDVRELWYVNWKTYTLFRSWRNREPLDYLDIYDKCKRHQLPLNSKRLQRRYNLSHPSTGFLLLAVLVDMYDKIYIHGYDIYESDKTHHYFGGADEATFVSKHDYKNTEYRHIKDLIKRGRIVFLDEDVEIVKAKFIDKEPKIIKCKTCGKTNTNYNWEQLLCNYCENIL